MSKNFFAALDDNDDDDDHDIKQQPIVKSVSRSNKTAATPASSNKENLDEPSRDPQQSPSHQHGRPGSGGTSGRGRGHGRGKSGERLPSKSGKRAYDRRSGTGRGTEIKKDGAGAHNWGSNKHEAKQAQGPVGKAALISADKDPEKEDTKTQESVEITPDGGRDEEVIETQENVIAEDPKEEEEVDNTISYDEYLKSRVRPSSELFAPKEQRKIENDFAKVTPKISTEEDFLVIGGIKQRERVREEKKKMTIVPSFKVASTDSQRSEGRGRGGERGGRGRGRGRSRDGKGGDRGGRGGRGRSTGSSNNSSSIGVVNPLDPTSFPSLS